MSVCCRSPRDAGESGTQGRALSLSAHTSARGSPHRRRKRPEPTARPSTRLRRFRSYCAEITADCLLVVHGERGGGQTAEGGELAAHMLRVLAALEGAMPVPMGFE